MSLVVIEAAADPKLLTIEQMRAAAGLDDDDTSQDAALTALNARISADIHDACRIAVASGHEPTLRQETLRETFRPSCITSARRRPPAPIILARRHEVEIVSIEAGGVTLAESDYELDNESGLIWRATDGQHQYWTGSPVTVTYKAGFAETPAVLANAALDMVRLRRSETERDPLVKKTVVDVDGVERLETEFWVTAGGSAQTLSTLPPVISASLRRFYNAAFA